MDKTLVGRTEGADGRADGRTAGKVTYTSIIGDVRTREKREGTGTRTYCCPPGQRLGSMCSHFHSAIETEHNVFGLKSERRQPKQNFALFAASTTQAAPTFWGKERAVLASTALLLWEETCVLPWRKLCPPVLNSSQPASRSSS